MGGHKTRKTCIRCSRSRAPSPVFTFRLFDFRHQSSSAPYLTPHFGDIPQSDRLPPFEGVIISCPAPGQPCRQVNTSLTGCCSVNWIFQTSGGKFGHGSEGMVILQCTHPQPRLAALSLLSSGLHLNGCRLQGSADAR